jgi:spore maturation protein CgeB
MVFPMAKAFEIMGCETLCMMDTPDEADELCFIPDWNFVSITRDNFQGKIWYYLEHEKERKQIAERGLYTCLQYHTVEVRTRELKTMLEEISHK